jgi:DNA-binding CsgD family transcriptional regulator
MQPLGLSMGLVMDDQQRLSRDWALTEREREVMKLAALGLSNKGIARQLGLVEGTVRIHLHSVYQKLGVANRTSLVAAIARGRIVRSLISGIVMLFGADPSAPRSEFVSASLSMSIDGYIKKNPGRQIT